MVPVYNLKNRISTLFVVSIAWALFVATLMSIVE